MDSAFPPRYVKIRTREIYNPNLSDALFRTLAQIRGLVHQPRGRQTPPLTIEYLAALRGVSQAAMFRHLAALRERGDIRTKTTGRHTFVIYLLGAKQDNAQGRSAPIEGKATLDGARDDGTAGAAETHLLACFPLCREPGATPPAHERGDAAPAKHTSLPQPGLNGHGADGAKLADVYDGAERRRASPGPPRPAGGTSASLKDENPIRKNENPTRKNENRSCHVVVKDHDSKQEEDLKQQHDHERAIRKNESDFDATLEDLAEVLVEYGMQPDEAQRQARGLLEECGADVCARQRQVFERRCELARASRRGLSNPVGLLCASIREDWSLPAAANERKTARWYTDEEFEAFFEH